MLASRGDHRGQLDHAASGSFQPPTDPNLINVPAGTGTLTRTGTNEDANSTGDLDVSSDMTIQGAGAATTTIDGNRSALTAATSDRVFDISGNSTVAINGVKITDGGAPTLANASPDGGGIKTAANLTMSNDVVTNNRAGSNHSFGGSGGGISSGGTLLSISASTRRSPATLRGTGRAAGTEGSSARDRQLSAGGRTFGGLGGGVFAPGLVLTNSTVAHNFARHEQRYGLATAAALTLARRRPSPTTLSPATPPAPAS